MKFIDKKMLEFAVAEVAEIGEIFTLHQIAESLMCNHPSEWFKEMNGYVKEHIGDPLAFAYSEISSVLIKFEMLERVGFTRTRGIRGKLELVSVWRRLL